MKKNFDSITANNHVSFQFTLLELLLVVFILSSVALATLFVVEFGDEQSRFEETRSRLQQIRRAIIGDPDRILMNNQSFISGFVADMGRLPNNLQELVEPPEEANELWSFDPAAGVWRGWRGPYLSVLSEVGSDTAVLRDGWGTRENGVDLLEENFGWLYEVMGDTTVTLKSAGANGDIDSMDTEYNQDFPSEDDFIKKNDHRVDLSLEFDIEFLNNTGGPTGAQNLRIGFSYASLIAPDAWPDLADRNSALFLSDATTAVPPLLNDGDTTLVQDVRFGQGMFTGQKHIPWGRRALVAFLENGGPGGTTELADSVTYNNTNVFEFLPRAAPPTIPVLEWIFE